MLFSQKPIFAGKGNLQAKPFCPYLSNENGYSNLLNHPSKPFIRSSRQGGIRPSLRDGRSRA